MSGVSQAANYTQLGFRAAAGDPIAIVQLAGVSAQLNKGAFQAIFTKAGVSPSFFASFQFLSFLDNSVGNWKSRSAKMSSWQPNQVLTWYIDKINKDKRWEDARQFIDLYGQGLYKRGAKVRDLQSKVSVDIAVIFNALVENLMFPNGKNTFEWTDGNGRQTVTKEEMLLDLTKTVGYLEAYRAYEQEKQAEQQQIQLQQASADTVAQTAKQTNIIIIVAIVAVVAVLAFSFFKK